MKYRTATATAVLLATALLTGCRPPAAVSQPPAPPTQPSPSPSADPCDPVIGQMTPRQRLAQLVVLGVDPTDPAAAANLVRDEQVGGIFIGGDATSLLTHDALTAVRAAARWGLSVAVDEEGGRVQRIDQLDGSLPSARTMARTMTVEQVRAAAAARGRELRARGVTVDFAPDADVSAEPDGGPIGDRSFSADPATARAYALAFATGLREGGVTPVLKHFPGHGHASGDSHDGTVRTPPLDSLRHNDLVPYERIADYGPAAVMVGHLTVPGLTAGLPASLSPEAYRLLRTGYGFTGPVITDDLGAMAAVTDLYRLPDAVVHALAAGADQALWSGGGDLAPVLDRLERAAADGELPATRVHEALDRVLTAKGTCH
ncbi:glycoside hydrolase family 3 protein [Amycolatopsis cynarae]|uniref:beta-N-acetylhexosaminidase n=1 Tax=Amycolatopsis cynarae TaxID=2995223 RepID=A0ABY7B9J5_9PSEU|nr:glycoside hydrolase family 3 N-terminal domain-containing protein [Amycolatopsis sp. HUAS 11-8]WAL69011.1 glycoside hydrolase family 3 protein [Amycolatopsis sp. HUAS 11-8]